MSPLSIYRVSLPGSLRFYISIFYYSYIMRFLSSPSLLIKGKMASHCSLSPRIEELENSLKVLSKDVSGDENARKKLLAIVREQTTVLESPAEVIWRMMMEV